jgi:hypothetical protein
LCQPDHQPSYHRGAVSRVKLLPLCKLHRLRDVP